MLSLVISIRWKLQKIYAVYLTVVQTLSLEVREYDLVMKKKINVWNGSIFTEFLKEHKNLVCFS